MRISIDCVGSSPLPAFEGLLGRSLSHPDGEEYVVGAGVLPGTFVDGQKILKISGIGTLPGPDPWRLRIRVQGVRDPYPFPDNQIVSDVLNGPAVVDEIIPANADPHLFETGWSVATNLAFDTLVYITAQVPNGAMAGHWQTAHIHIQEARETPQRSAQTWYWGALPILGGTTLNLGLTTPEVIDFGAWPKNSKLRLEFTSRWSISGASDGDPQISLGGSQFPELTTDLDGNSFIDETSHGAVIIDTDDFVFQPDISSATRSGVVEILNPGGLQPVRAFIPAAPGGLFVDLQHLTLTITEVEIA